jgi:histidine triad (HIT) family protein
MTSSDSKRIDCVFCRIGRGEDKSVEMVCDGESWTAFFPLNPATPGHTLIIPRMHVADLWQVKPTEGADLMAAVIKVGCAIESALGPEGMNLITSAGSAAEQTVFHLHMHLVPRWTNDGFGRIWPNDEKYKNTNLRSIANLIRKVCTGTTNELRSPTE